MYDYSAVRRVSRPRRTLAGLLGLGTTIPATDIVAWLNTNAGNPAEVARQANATNTSVGDILDAYARTAPAQGMSIDRIIAYAMSNNIPIVSGYIYPIGSMGAGTVALRSQAGPGGANVTILPAEQSAPAAPAAPAVPATLPAIQPLPLLVSEYDADRVAAQEQPGTASIPLLTRVTDAVTGVFSSNAIDAPLVESALDEHASVIDQFVALPAWAKIGLAIVAVKVLS